MGLVAGHQFKVVLDRLRREHGVTTADRPSDTVQIARDPARQAVWKNNDHKNDYDIELILPQTCRLANPAVARMRASSIPAEDLAWGLPMPYFGLKCVVWLPGQFGRRCSSYLFAKLSISRLR